MLENQHKRSLHDDVSHLKQLVPLLGSTQLDRIHMGTLQPWIEAKKKAGELPVPSIMELRLYGVFSIWQRPNGSMNMG